MQCFPVACTCTTHDRSRDFSRSQLEPSVFSMTRVKRSTRTTTVHRRENIIVGRGIKFRAMICARIGRGAGVLREQLSSVRAATMKYAIGVGTCFMANNCGRLAFQDRSLWESRVRLDSTVSFYLNNGWRGGSFST